MLRKITALTLALLLLLTLTVTAAAAENTDFVFDEADLLTDGEEKDLNALADTVCRTYGCGLYMMTVDDYTDYGSDDVFEATYGIYHDKQLGAGSGRDGILLLLSMEARDYAFFVYGDTAEYAFNSYGQAQFEEEFLDNFGFDDWYGGFRDYLSAGSDYLDRAAQGDPVRRSPTGPIVIAVLIACLISFLITISFWMKMKNVYLQRSAADYVSPQGLNLTNTQDVFTHKTHVRRKIQRSNSSGSGAHSGGGGSGRSGKF